MNTVAARGDYKVIVFNGAATYFVMDSADQCYKYYTNEKAAIKKMNRIAEMAGQ